MAAFGAPSMLMLIYRSSAYMLPALYAERFKFDMAELAGILLVMRTAEVLLQMPAGVLSDATRHARWGRKPLVMAGLMLGGIATCFVYTPPDTAGLVYFAGWLCLATIAGSLTEVAYGAWSTEITDDYRERARCASYQTWASLAGKELYSVVPLLGGLVGVLSSERMNFESLQLTAWILAALLPIICVWSWAVAPAGRTATRTERVSLRQMLGLVMDNKPLQRALLAMALWEMGVGFFFGLDFLRIDSYLKAGEAIPLQGLFGVWAAMAGLIGLQWVLKRQEKHHVWALSMGAVAATLLMQLMLAPGMAGLVSILVVFSMVLMATLAGAIVVPTSLAGDLSDYEGLRAGNRAAGPLVAVTQLTVKLTGGVAAASSLWLVSLFGFQPGQPSYDAQAAFGIQFVALALPALLMGVAAVIAWRYPITARRHKAIIRALERKGKPTASHESVAP